MCNCKVSKSAFNCACACKILSVSASNCGFDELTADRTISYKLLGLCASDCKIGESALDCNACKLLSLGMCNCKVGKSAFNCACACEILRISASDSGFNNLALDRAVGYKLLGFCASNICIGKSALNGSNCRKILRISACDCEIGESTLDYNLSKILFISASDISGCKLTVNVGGVTVSHGVCTSNVKVGKCAANSYRSGKILRISASDCCFNELTLNRAVGYKLLRLCAGYLNGSDASNCGSNVTYVDSFSASDLGLGYGILNRCYFNSSDCLCVSDISGCKSACGSLGLTKRLLLSASYVELRELAYCIATVGNCQTLCSCKIKLSKLRKLCYRIESSNILCAGKISGSNSAFNRCYVNGLLSLSANNLGFYNSTLNGFGGFKYFGFCASNIGGSESALYGSYVTSLISISARYTLSSDSIRMSNLSFYNGSAKRLLFSASKNYLGKIERYGSNLFYRFATGNVSLDNNLGIVVLDNSG